MARFIKQFFVATLLVTPMCAFADYGYFTTPLTLLDTNGVSSWFDHTSPLGVNDTSTTMTRYDGAVFTVSTTISACTIGNMSAGSRRKIAQLRER